MFKWFKNTKGTFWITSGALLIIGFVFVILSQTITNSFWQATCSNCASAIIVAGIFSIISETITKEQLIDTILTRMNLKKEIDETGIEDVFTDISDVDYRYYFKSAKKNIDIVHVYGRTWTTNNMDEIKDRYLNSNCDIRVVLVSPQSPFIDGLADFYNITSDELRDRIQEVTNMWKQTYLEKKEKRGRKTTQSTLKLYYHKKQPVSSLYRIDDRIINVQNKFCAGRSKKLATIICKNTKNNSDIYNDFFEDINDLVSVSDEVSLD
ncbi:hypothetical protein AB2T96_11145 [Clostridium butyricum]|uniref:hypothetical protein n=1 Tax=Clostridium butyricum TaxID=1492 RepID=UPI001CA882FB|nr:hypothetical protein [Clostridium butyricum]MBZ0312753.1 hypothetical protein [Clostridium butyricum]